MTTLHLMVGLPCSGKTTLAKELESELGALRLTLDDWHRALFGQDAEHPEHDERHRKIEDLQWEIAKTALALGIDVILDFGLWARAERDEYRRRASALGADTRIHFLNAPFDELCDRLEVRNRQSPGAVTIIPLALMREYLPRFQPPDEEELESPQLVARGLAVIE